MTKEVQASTSTSELPHKRNALLHKVSDARFFAVGVLSATMFFMGERTDSVWISFIFKPIPIYVLMAWVQWNAKTPSLFRRLILIGLFFGSLGTWPFFVVVWSAFR